MRLASFENQTSAQVPVPKKTPWAEPTEHDIKVGQVRRWNRNNNTFVVVSIISSEIDTMEDEVEVMYSDGFSHTMYASDMVQLFPDDDGYSVVVCDP